MSLTHPQAPAAPLALLALIAAPLGMAATRPMTLQVDARDIIQGIQHAHLSIPVRPGPLTLAYPRWIPGEHAAAGPTTQVVPLLITAGGEALPWRRDPLDAFLVRVEVPPQPNRLDAL